MEEEHKASLGFFGNVLCVNEHNSDTSGPIWSALFFSPAPAKLENQFDMVEKNRPGGQGTVF